MPSSSIYTEWLPEPIATKALQQEPRRFALGVAQLQQAIDAARASDSPNRWAALLSPVLDDVRT